jgi:hypothetical protein
MNKACLLLTAGLVAGIFAAGIAAATAASDRVARSGGHAGGSHAGWSTAKADDGRTVPVWSHAGWSRAYARTDEGCGSYFSGGYGYAAYDAAWDYPGWSLGGDGVDLADAALGLVTLGALGAAEHPYGYGYGYAGTRYGYSCVRTQWDPGVGYVRVRAPC